MSIATAVSMVLLLFGAAGQPDSGRGAPGAGAGAAAQQGPREGSLKVGDAAPDFTLSDREGKKTVRLSAFQGKRPVVLIFGSYT